MLRPLRLLPPRERLRVVVEVLPELEDELPATAEAAGFWQGSDIGVLAERQGVQPIGDFEALLGGWPEDESVDDFADVPGLDMISQGWSPGLRRAGEALRRIGAAVGFLPLIQPLLQSIDEIVKQRQEAIVNDPRRAVPVDIPG